MQLKAANRLPRLALGLATPLVLATALGIAAAPDASASSEARVKVPSVTVNEGQAARVALKLRCTRTYSCRYSVETRQISAIAWRDYVPRKVTKVVPRATRLTFSFDVATIDDKDCESPETFAVIVRNLTRGASDTATGTVTFNPDADCRTSPGPKWPLPPPPAQPPAPAPPPGPEQPPASSADSAAPVTSTTDYASGQIHACTTPQAIGVQGQFGAWGHYIAGCTVKLTCPTTVAVCAAKAESAINSEHYIGHKVTLNSRMRAYSAGALEFWHRDVSCENTDWCRTEDKVYIRGGESAEVQCNGVRQSGPETNRAKVSCTMDLQRT